MAISLQINPSPVYAKRAGAVYIVTSRRTPSLPCGLVGTVKAGQ